MALMCLDDPEPLSLTPLTLTQTHAQCLRGEARGRSACWRHRLQSPAVAACPEVALATLLANSPVLRKQRNLANFAAQGSAGRENIRIACMRTTVVASPHVERASAMARSYLDRRHIRHSQC